MTKKQRTILKFLLALVWVLFFIKSGVAVDSDFGWHIQTGQLIIHQGIPKLDPFSYTMPSYHFVDHEWLTDVILAKIFPVIGFWGLGLIFTSLAILSLAFVLDFSLADVMLLPTLAVSLLLLYYGGTRAQVITWFFLGLLFWIIFKNQKWPWLKYFIPLIFLLWANLHGGVLVGLAVLGVTWLGEIIQTRKIPIRDTAILILSTGATLLNPYGLHLWREIFLSLNDSYLHSIINEWMTPFLNPDLAFVSLFILSIFLLIYNWKKLRYAEILLYLGLTIAAAMATRHVPLWSLFILLILPRLWSIDLTKPLVAFLDKYAIGMGLIVTLFSLTLSGPAILLFRLDHFYPVAAVKYIRAQSPSAQIIAPYTWGGYLIWQLPQYKVFIDGRMPSWRNPSAPQNESQWIMKEYVDLTFNRTDVEAVLDKYHVNTILWSAKTNQSYFPFTLNPLLWRPVYHDNIAIIYERNELSSTAEK